MEQDGKWHCEYDKDGNLTERYIGTGRWLDGKKEHWKYRWNADGSLAEVVQPDGEEVTFEYDALGRRLSKSFRTTVTRWMWNGNVLLHQWKQKRSYSREEDAWLTEKERKERTLWLFEEESFVPAAMIKEGRAYSILTDHLGTPTEAYDADGNEVWSRTLDMNGEVIEESGNVGMIPFLFQGQYYDRETELAYNRFRYYSPLMGMYVSQDPIRLNGGITNIYAYVEDINSWLDILGLNTAPQLPPSLIVKEDGVTIEHYYYKNDHLPVHAHVKGEGNTVKIGENGKPLKGEPELSSQQQSVVEKNKSKIRSALNRINRWFKFNNYRRKNAYSKK